jgi:hypothetical protein
VTPPGEEHSGECGTADTDVLPEMADVPVFTASVQVSLALLSKDWNAVDSIGSELKPPGGCPLRAAWALRVGALASGYSRRPRASVAAGDSPNRCA